MSFVVLTSIITVARAEHIDTNAMFGKYMYEMPLRFGFGFAKQHPSCENFSSFVALTPKGLQFYVYERDRADVSLSSRVDEYEKLIDIKAGNCIFSFKISRSKIDNEKEVKLTPDATNGIPGAKGEPGTPSKSVFEQTLLDQLIMAPFPQTDTDCGRFSAGMFGDSHGISFITYPMQSDVAIAFGLHGYYKTFEFKKNQCTTLVVLSCSVLIDGKWRLVPPLANGDLFRLKGEE